MKPVCLLLALAVPLPAAAAELATGFKVGEVTPNSAVVWVRITKNKERNWDGFKDEKTTSTDKDPEYTPSRVAVDDRQGAAPGAPGEVRLTYARISQFEETPSVTTPWKAVDPQQDFTWQFHLTDLQPASAYVLRVEARKPGDQEFHTTLPGHFRTAAEPAVWQDVAFGVISCQGYWDLDNNQGYHIYPAMEQDRLNFVVLTGDTVYYDNDSPRARTMELARHHWHRMYSLPCLVKFHQNTPGYWQKDDHDAWCNDCFPGMKAPFMSPFTFEEGLEVFREQVPLAGKTYRTFRWGKGLQIWLVEGRDFRSPNKMKDGPEKSIWGAEQKKWLTETLLASDADFKVLISPTPIVGPDRENKSDNHANQSFHHEGQWFRDWTKEKQLTNLFVCCGDRHWQYYSVDPTTGLREFACGAASDEHAGGSPGENKEVQPFHRVKGGYLTVSVRQENNVPIIIFQHRDVRGKVVNEVQPSGKLP